MLTNQDAIEILRKNFNPILSSYVSTIPLHITELVNIDGIERPKDNIFKLTNFEIILDNDGQCKYINFQGKRYYTWHELYQDVI